MYTSCCRYYNRECVLPDEAESIMCSGNVHYVDAYVITLIKILCVSGIDFIRLVKRSYCWFIEIVIVYTGDLSQEY